MARYEDKNYRGPTAEVVRNMGGRHGSKKESAKSKLEPIYKKSKKS